MFKSKVRQDGHATAISHLAAMQENGELCDFTIIVAGQEISAHKCILAALCEYFRAAFRFGCSSQAEVFTAERSNSLDLTHLGCQHEVVEDVVRSFYTNEINLAPSLVQDLLLLADYLMYPELKNCVEAYMLQTLDHHTAVMYFQLVKHYGLNAAHFHDYFINQADAVSINTDTLQQYVFTGFFKFCSPLQICKFLLSTLDTILEKPVICDGAHNSSLHHDASRINQISSLLIQVFSSFPPCHITQWRKLVLQCIQEWKLKSFSDSKASPSLQEAFEKLKSITECQVSIKFCPPSHNCSVCSQIAASNKMPEQNTTAPSSSPVQDTDSNSSSGSKQASGICLRQSKTTMVVNSSECTQGLDKSNVCSTSLTSSPNVEPRQNQEIIVKSPSPEFFPSNILVLLAPSTEMSSQLMATDEGKRSCLENLECLIFNIIIQSKPSYLVLPEH
ncbi:kelch-like 22 [Plakobranchus ocellatus]|uniref:Kelch-like 22 n=1 Tax=Plakobranchus ocellatus TaxID=259542 RepID=A0AAV4C326_9GAST|nr:kelch-like 22 [Plakobranchus ocellatus]